MAVKKAKCNAAQKPFHWPENWADFHAWWWVALVPRWHSDCNDSRTFPQTNLQWHAGRPFCLLRFTPDGQKVPDWSFFYLLFYAHFATIWRKMWLHHWEQSGKCQAEQNYKFKLQRKKRRKKTQRRWMAGFLRKTGCLSQWMYTGTLGERTAGERQEGRRFSMFVMFAGEKTTSVTSRMGRNNTEPACAWTKPKKKRMELWESCRSLQTQQSHI